MFKIAFCNISIDSDSNPTMNRVSNHSYDKDLCQDWSICHFYRLKRLFVEFYDANFIKTIIPKL